MPPGSDSAIRASVSSRSYGYGGGTKPPDAGTRASLMGDARKLGETPDGRVGEPGTYAGAVAVVHLDEHFARTVQGGEHIAALVRHEELAHVREGAEPIADRFEQLGHAFAGRGRDRDRSRD